MMLGLTKNTTSAELFFEGGFDLRGLLSKLQFLIYLLGPLLVKNGFFGFGLIKKIIIFNS